MKKITAGLGMTLAMGVGSVLAAPAVAIPPTYGSAQIVDACQGQVVASGRLVDDAGVAHPHATWSLKRTGRQGGSYCLRVFDGMAGPHVMSASLSNGASGAYTSGMSEAATQGVLVYNARRTSLTVSGSIVGDDGTFYQVRRTIAGR